MDAVFFWPYLTLLDGVFRLPFPCGLPQGSPRLARAVPSAPRGGICGAQVHYPHFHRKVFVMHRTPLKVTLALLTPLLLLLALHSPGLQARATSPTVTLTYSERLACQRAIEETLWAHRTWPAENDGSKPSLSEVLPADVLT